ncbi:DENN domain-containing protein 2A-like isoform X2 [Cimex lectularius]|uniref:UDENN domain-containing protein n=1 Tax=Cimex lectularius TaxID=79782 RepID=A0A8I6SC69_CIMLE|nr:DENN domain-containing protein 2A-like isoform X2 [Cimex lectularius]
MESGLKVQEIRKRFENLNPSIITRPELSEKKNEVENSPSKGGCEPQNRGLVKRTPAFRTPKGKTKPKRQDELTDTLKKKLEAPLPVGPAPKKPPRTFAHGNTEDRPLMRRSKTEPHIMLKKIESALLSNQAPFQAEKPKPAPRTNNNHVYDTPSNSNNRPRQGNNCFPVFCNRREPLYMEPYAPKISTRDAPNTTKPMTLHYLSSPIMLDNQVSQNGVKPIISLYENTIRNIQMKMSEPFNNTKSETDSDGDSIKDIKSIQEKKIYAKRNCSVKEFKRYSNEDTSNLIDALLLIGLDNDINRGNVGFIHSKFPRDIKVPDNFASLIFPDADNWSVVQVPDYIPKSARHNNYTIFITAADGSRSFAYCRRVQPEGSLVCLPLAYVILTSHRPNTLYYKILATVESKHGIPKLEFNRFVNLLLQAKFPKKQESLLIGDWRLHSSLDERQESSNISTLLQILSVPIFIQILASLLLERKIILVGSFISVLSDCIEGLLKSLYPFEWQHTIVSLLPISMSEILQAPTPYIVGLLKNRKWPIKKMFFSEIEDVIVVDVDNGTVVKRQGDEGSIIPEQLSKSLKQALYLVPVHSIDIAPSEALIRLFVELVGHYSNFLISTVPDKDRQFQKEQFINAPSSKSVRLYLEWFTETALFHTFIKQRMERRNQLGLFEQRCAEYIEKRVSKGKKEKLSPL